MRAAVEQSVVDTLDYIMTLVREGTRPDEAKSGFRPLQRRHSDVGMRLIWEEETFDHSVHYDALLNFPGSGTVSLSYCEDRTKPWPLRGVQRWDDADLVRVNNNVLSVDQAIACLDFIWDEARIADRLVNVCLIEEEFEKNPIDISDQELQAAMDVFRRARKLYKAEDTLRWMERRGITHQQLESMMSAQARLVKLRDKVTGGRIDEYFCAHSADFDTAYISRFVVADERKASEFADLIRNGVLDFVSAAQRYFIEEKRSRQAMTNFFSTVQRREAPAEIRDVLFQSAPGSILGPVREGDDYTIFSVLRVVPAILDEDARDGIKKVLFEQWLDERRQAASIEWLWGNVANCKGGQ